MCLMSQQSFFVSQYFYCDINRCIARYDMTVVYPMTTRFRPAAFAS